MTYKLETTNEVLNGSVEHDQRTWTLHSEHSSLKDLNAAAKNTLSFGTYIRGIAPDGTVYTEYDNYYGFQVNNPHDD